MRPPNSPGLCPWSKAGRGWEGLTMVVEELELIHSLKHRPSCHGWASSAPPARTELYQGTKSNFLPMTFGNWAEASDGTNLWWQLRSTLIRSIPLRAWQLHHTFQLCHLLAHTHPLHAPGFSAQVILPLWPKGKYCHGPLEPCSITIKPFLTLSLVAHDSIWKTCSPLIVPPCLLPTELGDVQACYSLPLLGKCTG